MKGALCPSLDLGAWGRGDHTRVGPPPPEWSEGSPAGSGFAWSLLLAVDLQNGWIPRIMSFSGPLSTG